MVTEQDVRNAYRIILGRDPENEEVLRLHARTATNLSELWLRFLESREFAERTKADSFGRDELNVVPPDAPPMAVDVSVSDAYAQRLLDRIHKQWQRLGESRPYWSVLTSERFQPAEIERHRQAFYETGRLDVARFRWALERNGIDVAQLGSCLEFGCGVGRATAHLAPIFRRLVAVDISDAHLAEARARFDLEGIGGTTFVHATGIDHLPELGRFGAVFSIIVLQHNPPPVMARLLAHLLNAVKPGGVAFLQIATYCVGYRFDVEAYLASPEGEGMEVHFLPQRDVFRIVREAKCDLIEIREDGYLGRSNAWLSNSLLIQRPAA
jgi:SAM-dependent methyltransferase